MRRRGWVLLGSLVFSGALVGCARDSRVEDPSVHVKGGDDDEVTATAEALLSAWFGCAMGETWMAALETPPYTWAAPSLARCHAVGRVVDAPAARLRAFVPEAVTAVSSGLDRRLGPASGYSMNERLETLELFSAGTKALKELSTSFDIAKDLAKDRASVAKTELGRASVAEAAVAPAKGATRARFFRMSRADGLLDLWSLGNRRAGVRSAQATALSWMIVLQRLHKARELPEELRAAHVALAFETVADVPRPADWTGHGPTKESWEAYLARVAKRMGVMGQHSVTAEREAYAQVTRAIAERLRAAAHPLPATELRRATLGCAEAFLRETQ